MDPSGQYWWVGYGPDTRYTHVMPPNSKNCVYNGNAGPGAYSATSRHAGGVNVLFADGSVKFVKSSTNAQTWWAVGTKANGEVISSDAF